MDYKVSSVLLIFENCDSVSFASNQIGNCQICNIHESISRIAMNAIADVETADEVFLEIAADANKEHVPFGIDTGIGLSKETVFDRIKQGDITQIVLSYEDGSEFTLRVPFDYESSNATDSGCRNKYQDVYESALGLHLCISISERKAVDYVREQNQSGNVFLEQIVEDLKQSCPSKEVRPACMTDVQVKAYLDSIQESDFYQHLERLRQAGLDEDGIYEKFFSGILDLLRVHGYDPDWMRDVFEPQLAEMYQY